MIRSALFASVLLAVAPAFADDGAVDMTGKKELDMQHCPSTVPGATTKVTDRADGVELRVQAASDPIAQAEIRSRAQFQLEIIDAPERSAIEHTGLGTGSGRYGFCPGMLAGTSLELRWLPDGAVLIIRADTPAAVKRLQKSTHKRVKALEAKVHRVAAR